MEEENRENGDFGTSEISRNGLTITVGATGAMPVADDPWKDAESRYPVGTKLHGKVVNFKPYGFFVETDEGFFGLVHGSQIEGWSWKDRFDEVFRFGQEVDVSVTKVDVESHRMAFSCTMPETPEESQPAVAEPSSLTYGEIAEKWAAENPGASEAARQWLAKELDDGPMYGPLANVLSDRFDVPVPVSFWIRQFPEFVCFGGKGDNPSELPAVALSAKSGDDDYWKCFKAKAGELACNRTAEKEALAKYGPIALRLNELADFPGVSAIRRHRATAATFQAAGTSYGAADAQERLVLPALSMLGWETASEDPARKTVVRGGTDVAGLRLYVGEPGAERLALAIVCDAANVSFRSLVDRSDNPGSVLGRNGIERVLGFCNRTKDFTDGFTRLVWTNGVEWVIFTDLAVTRRIGILSDRTGGKILSETAESDDNAYYRRIVLPVTGETLDWLAAFAGLDELLGPSRKGA